MYTRLSGTTIVWSHSIDEVYFRELMDRLGVSIYSEHSTCVILFFEIIVVFADPPRIQQMHNIIVILFNNPFPTFINDLHALVYFSRWLLLSFTDPPRIQQMHKILCVVSLTFIIALFNNILPTIPSLHIQMLGFFTQAVERTAVTVCACAFLTHV